MKKIDVNRLSELLFRQKEKTPQIDFYGDYNEVTNEGEYCFKIAVVKFADAFMVIANYYGGGKPFCIDISDDKDAFRLKFELASYMRKNEIGDEYSVWIDP